MFVIYDASFNGLLSAIAWCLRQNTMPIALLSDLEPTTLLEAVAIPSEPGIRRFFCRHYAARLGGPAAEEVLDTVYRAFLSEQPGMATRILTYLNMAWRDRCNPAGRLYDPAVAEVVGAARRVSGQAHQYLGLLRFRRIGDDLFLADFEPDYHVLPLILPHFADRLSGQAFVICDRRRGIAAWHRAGGGCSLHQMAAEDAQAPDTPRLAQQAAGTRLTAGPGSPAKRRSPDRPSGERLPERPPAGQLPMERLAAEQLSVHRIAAEEQSADFEDMWRKYLQHLTIPERRNLALQRSHMPKKYWKYLTEQSFGA